MKHNFIVGLIVAFVLAIPFVFGASPVLEQGLVAGKDYAPGSLSVMVEKNAFRGLNDVESALRGADKFSAILSVEYFFDDPDNMNDLAKEYGLDRVYLIKVDPDRTLELFDALSRVDGVEAVDLDWIFTLAQIPNDEFYYQQWGLNQTSDIDIDAPEAWDLETGSSDIVIAVLDSGIDYYHEDLANKIWVNPGEDANGNGVPELLPFPEGDLDNTDGDGNGKFDDVMGWDFVNTASGCVDVDCFTQDNDPLDGFGHGTHVSGMVGAETNNLIGVASLCQNCKIMPMRVAWNDGSVGAVNLFYVRDGIYYAVNNGADVVSMSFGKTDSDCSYGVNPPSGVDPALDFAYGSGVVLVAAAGNYGNDGFVYPACYSKVIGVANLDVDGDKSDLSNFGSWVDVAAPGNYIKTTVLGGGYGTTGGTSLSAPFVSSLAGLLLSSYPDFSPAQVEQVIQDSSEDKAYWQGTWSLEAGRINAFNALNEFCVFNNVSLVWNNTCVAPKPKRCVNHQVVNSCQVCGCPIASAGRHYECQGDGSCRLIGRKIKATAIEPPMG